MTDTAVRYDLDAPVPFHPLVYFPEGDEITIGRRDIDSYGIFPPDGAAVVRRLETGETPKQVADWPQWIEPQHSISVALVHRNPILATSAHGIGNPAPCHE